MSEMHRTTHMASVYASVVSLWNTLLQLQTHPFFSTSLDTKQIQSLCRKVSFLEDFLQRYSHGGSQQAQDLQRRIYLAAYQAEYLIDYHTAIQMYVDDSKTLLLCLQNVTDKIDCIIEKVKEIWDLQNVVKVQRLNGYSERPVAESTRAPSTGGSTMVGFEGQRSQIMDMLTRGLTSSLQIISITGMGGAGKTTLATSIYTDLCMERRFDIRIWVTISQDYTMRDVLLQFPMCKEEQAKFQRKKEEQGKFQKEEEQAKDCDELTDVQLGEDVLYKSLWNRRYLIVMDDMWSEDVWNDMRSFFPENGNHSRILVTTRLTNVAKGLGSKNLKLTFLEEYQSWELFCESAFNGACCPNDLKDVGKKIVKKCKGHPLSITVIGGLLGKSCKTVQHWESVAEDVTNTILADDEDHCFRVLCLSYTHLPTHLKPCFVYMGIFPEDHEIRASELINLWIAEGFIKPGEDKSLEESAREYLNDLVDRNLVSVRRRGRRGKITICYIHDAWRDLCQKVAQEEDFFCIQKESEDPQITHGVCRIVSNGISVSPASSFTRSYINFGRPHWFSLENRPQIRVLRNAEVKLQKDSQQGVNLRYFHLSDWFSVISGFSWLRSLLEYTLYEYRWYGRSLVSEFWNVQTIIVTGRFRNKIEGLREIWEMQQLRHVQAKNMYLEYPRRGAYCVLRNLHTLMEIVNFRWSRGIVERIPCMKKIKLIFDPSDAWASFDPNQFGLRHLHLLKNLESLYIHFHGSYKEYFCDWFKVRFPDSLKKLSLTSFSWDAMTLLGSLPHLEVLKVRGKVQGDEWNPIEGELFRSLKYLEVDDCEDLKYWNANSSHFPALGTLKFGYAPNLEKIPSDVGDIPTLEVISIGGCTLSAAISALKILNEQEDFGNDLLQVRVEMENAGDIEILRKYMEDNGLTSNNFLSRRARFRPTFRPGIVHGYLATFLPPSWEEFKKLSDSAERDLLLSAFRSPHATTASLRQRLLEGSLLRKNRERNLEIEGLKAEHAFRNKEMHKQLAAASCRTHNRFCTKNKNNNMRKNFG